ncbi:MAG: hypothetical protein ABI376_09705 [Caulobacteraceae bacterium]
MTYLTAFAIVVAAAAAAAGASWILSGWVAIETRRRHHEIGGQVFLQLGVVFAVLLAFVFNEAWGEYNTAAQAIDGECGSLHGAAMIAAALPDGQGRPMTAAIETYAAVVVHEEWPAMARRRRSGEAGADFQRMITVATKLPAAAPGQVAGQAQILSLLAQAHDSRETRLFQMTQALPAALWFVLIAIAVVLIAFVLMAGIETPGLMIFATAFTGCTAMILVLLKLLDYPFEGSVALGPTDFIDLAAKVAPLAR